MVKNAIFVIATLLLLCPYAHGGWVSGGGEIAMDSHNPWFLLPMKTVRYCIQIDEQNFGLTLSEAKRVTAQAIDYWKNEFVYAQMPTDHQQIPIARQDFIYGPCDVNTDLRFQLGYLLTDQEQFFKSQSLRPQDFVGIAIRTKYDKALLKAKGFIYISPESGPLRMRLRNILRYPWSLRDFPSDQRGHGLLHKILVHELGHIFGLEHWMGPRHRKKYNIMDAGLPLRLVKSSPLERLEDAHLIETIPGFFSYLGSELGELKNPSEELLSLFGIDEFDLPIESIEVRKFQNQYQVIGRSKDHGKLVMGIMEEDKTSEKKGFLPVIKIKLNPEQLIFPGATKDTLLGPGLQFLNISGVFINTFSNRRSHVYFNSNPLLKQLHIGGILHGSLISQ